MRRIKSFFGNQTFFGKNYKIFTFISSKSDIWQKMHVPCKNILDGQSLTVPCGRHRHKPASARRQRPARSRPPGRQSGQSRRPRPALRRPADGQADVVPAALPDVVVVTGEKVLSPTACGRSSLAGGAKKKQTASLRTRFVCCLLIPLSPLRGAGAQCPPAPSG